MKDRRGEDDFLFGAELQEYCLLECRLLALLMEKVRDDDLIEVDAAPAHWRHRLEIVRNA